MNHHGSASHVSSWSPQPHSTSAEDLLHRMAFVRSQMVEVTSSTPKDASIERWSEAVAAKRDTSGAQTSTLDSLVATRHKSQETMRPFVTPPSPIKPTSANYYSPTPSFSFRGRQSSPDATSAFSKTPPPSPLLPTRAAGGQKGNRRSESIPNGDVGEALRFDMSPPPVPAAPSGAYERALNLPTAIPADTHPTQGNPIVLQMQCDALARRNAALTDKVAELVEVIQQLQVPNKNTNATAVMSIGSPLIAADRAPSSSPAAVEHQHRSGMRAVHFAEDGSQGARSTGVAFESDDDDEDFPEPSDAGSGEEADHDLRASIGRRKGPSSSENEAIVAMFDKVSQRQLAQEFHIQTLRLEQRYVSERADIVSAEREGLLRILSQWMWRPKPTSSKSDTGRKSFALLESHATTTVPTPRPPVSATAGRDSSSSVVGDGRVFVRMKRDPLEMCLSQWERRRAGADVK